MDRSGVRLFLKMKRALLLIPVILLCWLSLWYSLYVANSLSSSSILFNESSSRTSILLNESSSVLPRTGYVLNYRYSGQQGAGIQGLISQQCWVKSHNLPLRIVEPFIRNSVLYGFPNMEDKQELRLRDVIDIDQFTVVSRGQGYEPLASWEELLKTAPRNIIIIDTIDTGTEREPPELVWKSTGPTTCYYNYSIVEGVEVLAAENGFCIVRIIHLRPKGMMDHDTSDSIFTVDEMYTTILGEWKLQDVTLVFKRWTWHWNVSNTEQSISCKDALKEGLNEKLNPNRQLLEYAMMYEERFMQGKRPFHVAVMMRAERVVIWELKENATSLNDCLEQVVNTVKDLQGTHTPFVTVDTGKYGSKSWYEEDHIILTDSQRSAIFHAVADTVTLLLNGSMSFEQWEDSFSLVAGGERQASYIAMLQRTLASRADCLVIMGGGQFMKLALYEYQGNHPDPSTWCVRLICLDSRFEREYWDILDARFGQL